VISRRCAQSGHDAAPSERFCRTCAEEIADCKIVGHKWREDGNCEHCWEHQAPKPRQNAILDGLHPDVGLVCTTPATGCAPPFPHWHLGGVRKEGFPGDVPADVPIGEAS